ncbi:MAG: hypothetical protein ACR2PO_06755 [Methyloligellaceae bacterium]
MARAIFLVGVLLLLTASRGDQPGDRIATQALKNAGHEVSQCIAYYNIVSAALGRDERNNDLAERYAKLAEALVTRALAISTRTGQTRESAIAKLDAVQDQMLRSIRNGVTDLLILRAKYGQHCRSVWENPDQRLQHWLGLELNKRLGQ